MIACPCTQDLFSIRYIDMGTSGYKELDVDGKRREQ